MVTWLAGRLRASCLYEDSDSELARDSCLLECLPLSLAGSPLLRERLSDLAEVEVLVFLVDLQRLLEG